MQELIDRQKTIRDIETLCKVYMLHEPAGMGGMSAIRICKEIVEKQPTIEPGVLNFNSLGIDIESIETRYDEEVTNEPDELHALENLERIYGDIMDAIKKLRGNT